MAILTEETVDGRIRHYSNQNLKIRQIETGIIYDEAVDVIPCRYTYEETDEPIEYGEEELNSEQALNIILGTNEY